MYTKAVDQHSEVRRLLKFHLIWSEVIYGIDTKVLHMPLEAPDIAMAAAHLRVNDHLNHLPLL